MRERIQQLLPEAAALNDDLAAHPELSGEEVYASAAIRSLMEKHGFTVEMPFAGLPTAFKAVSGSNSHRHKAAILAEYDALNKLGHACGHCASGAISVCAAIALADLQDKLDTDIHLIGTPGEELLACKCDMIEAHAFDGYDLAIMIHLNNKNLASCRLYAIDTYAYTFHGKAAHAAAAPWEGRNALNALQLFFHAIDMLRQHVPAETLMHGYISNGGAAANIVPDETSAEINIRSSSAGNLDELSRLVDDCAKGAAIATQTTWEKVRTSPRNTDLVQNPFGNQLMEEVYRSLDIKIDREEHYFGSSDIGNVSYVCPTFQPTLNITCDGAPLHSASFAAQMTTQKAHETIALGAEVICRFVERCFASEENVQRLKESQIIKDDMR